MIVRHEQTMITIYVVSKNSRKRKIEDMRVFTEVQTHWLFKLVLGHLLCPDA